AATQTQETRTLPEGEHRGIGVAQEVPFEPQRATVEMINSGCFGEGMEREGRFVLERDAPGVSENRELPRLPLDGTQVGFSTQVIAGSVSLRAICQAHGEP